MIKASNDYELTKIPTLQGYLCQPAKYWWFIELHCNTVFGQNQSIILNTVSSHIHLPCFCTYPPPLDVSVHGLYLRKLIGQVSSDLLYMRFTHCIKDNQQGCSSNWFPLVCLGPWMNHFPPVWWSNSCFIYICSWFANHISSQIDLLSKNVFLY